MIRLMHGLIITALILSAAWVYRIKYETIANAERIQQVKIAIQKERDAIATLKAQWARLNRPERLQELASRHLGLQPMSTEQLLKVGDLPQKPERKEGMGALIEALNGDGNEMTGTISRKIFEGPVPLPQPNPLGGARR